MCVCVGVGVITDPHPVSLGFRQLSKLCATKKISMPHCKLTVVVVDDERGRSFAVAIVSQVPSGRDMFALEFL